MDNENTEKKEIEAYPKYDPLTIFNSRVSDEMFIEISKKFKDLDETNNPLYERIVFLSNIKDLYRLPNDMYGLLFPVKREIQGVVHQFGFKPEVLFQVNDIVNEYVRHHLMSSDFEDDILQRLSKCIDDVEKTELLQLEMSQLEGRIQEISKHSKQYRAAYETEGLKKEQWYEHIGSLWIGPLPDNQLDEHTLFLIVLGAQDRKNKSFLRRMQSLYGVELTPVHHDDVNSAVDIAQSGTTLDKMFSKPEHYSLCLDLLEHLEVTEDGKCILGFKGGKMFAALTAIKETPGLPRRDYTDNDLLYAFNMHLGKNYQQVKRTSNEYKEAYDDANRFLRQHFKK